jgi:hypothetical protein
VITVANIDSIPEPLSGYFKSITPTSEIDVFNLIDNRLLLRNKDGYEGAFNYRLVKTITECQINKDNRLEFGSFTWALPASEDRSPLFLVNGDNVIAVSQYDYSVNE